MVRWCLSALASCREVGILVQELILPLKTHRVYSCCISYYHPNKREVFQQVLINKDLPSLSRSQQEAPGVKSRQLLQLDVVRQVSVTGELQCFEHSVLKSVQGVTVNIQSMLMFTPCTGKYITTEDSILPPSSYKTQLTVKKPTSRQTTLIILSFLARHKPSYSSIYL